MGYHSQERFWLREMDERKEFWRLFILSFAGFPWREFSWSFVWSFSCWLRSIVLAALEFKQCCSWTLYSRFAKDQNQATQKTVWILCDLESYFPSYSWCRWLGFKVNPGPDGGITTDISLNRTVRNGHLRSKLSFPKGAIDKMTYKWLNSGQTHREYQNSTRWPKYINLLRSADLLFLGAVAQQNEFHVFLIHFYNRSLKNKSHISKTPLIS